MSVHTVAKARLWKHRERFPDFTSRAAAYAIRAYGGKGGAPRKWRPYPNRFSLVCPFGFWWACARQFSCGGWVPASGERLAGWFPFGISKN